MNRRLYLMMWILVIAACQPRPSVTPASSSTPLPSPTPVPTISTLIQPVLPSVPLPTATPTCEGAPATQLIVNERGRSRRCG